VKTWFQSLLRSNATCTATAWSETTDVLEAQTARVLQAQRHVGGQTQNVIEAQAPAVMKSTEEWNRFMRFMERYAEDNGLGFSKN
jgi:photosystem II reaction center protein Psb28